MGTLRADCGRRTAHHRCGHSRTCVGRCCDHAQSLMGNRDYLGLLVMTTSGPPPARGAPIKASTVRDPRERCCPLLLAMLTGTKRLLGCPTAVPQHVVELGNSCEPLRKPSEQCPCSAALHG
jgi:hypothetical protein